MRLHGKLMVGMLVALLVSTLGIWMAINAIIAPTYADLETQDAKKAAAVALETYRDISRNLGDRTADWALWDDCYEFMKNRDKSFIESNLNPESFKSAKVDFILFIGNNGKPVHLFSVEPLALQKIAQDMAFPWPLHKDVSLRNTGFLASGGQAYFVAVSQIHKSGGSAPSRGWLVMGRKITHTTSRELSQRTNSTTEWVVGSSERSLIPVIGRTNPTSLSISQAVLGLDGKPAGTLVVTVPRTTILRGEQASHVLLWTFIALLLLTTLILAYLARHYVVDRLRRLEKRVSSVQPGEFYAELDDDGKDEISSLTGRVNEMFTKLHDYSTELEVQKEHLEFEVHRRTESLLQLNSVLANALDGIIHTSDRGEIVSMNQVAGRLLDPLTIGDRICTNLDEQSREAMSYGYASLYRKDRVELNLTSKTGRSFDAVLIPERDTAGDVISVHVFLQDVTERDALLRTVEHQAEHDDLTGLPNRRKFLNHLQNLMDDGVNVGLAFVDLDNFKYFNDSLGHSVGDYLLNEIALRLSRLAGQNGFVARLGGDEFILIFQNPDMEVVDQLAREVVEAVKEPIQAEGRELYATCSVGLAVRREDSDAESLLRDADIAMYQAKQNGKADYAIFDQSMNDRVVERMELETGLRVALEREEIFLVYQPIMELGSRSFSGVEALIRWKHPELGLIPPDKFIPIAEETGLILSLGRYALKTACQKAAEWNQLSRDPIGVQVNLSQRQIQTGGFAKVVEETLKETGLKPQLLTLEITESLAVADVSLAIRMLQELRDLGVKIAIDDFGTGFSSLSNLQRLPIDNVKIDRSFVHVLGHEKAPTAVISAILTLCRALNLTVTGEGIETEEQMMRLSAMGCDKGQGYLLGRPISAEAVETILCNNRIDDSKAA